MPGKRFSLPRHIPLLRNTFAVFHCWSKWFAVALCWIPWHSFAKTPLFFLSAHLEEKKNLHCYTGRTVIHFWCEKAVGQHVKCISLLMNCPVFRHLRQYFLSLSQPRKPLPERTDIISVPVGKTFNAKCPACTSCSSTAFPLLPGKQQSKYSVSHFKNRRDAGFQRG